jgi:DNA-binding protein YbaB
MTTASPHQGQDPAGDSRRSHDPHQAFEKAMAELAQTQERLRETRAQLAAKPTKVTSKDGMITMTLDGGGEVTEIKFNTAKFRRMAPAELGAALVDAFSRARAEGRARMIEAYRPFLPAGLDPDQILAGKINVDGMFASARERSEQVFAAAQATGPARPSTGKV